MFRNILTILLIAFLTVPLFATPTHKSKEHGKNEISTDGKNMHPSTNDKHNMSSNDDKNVSLKKDDGDDISIEIVMKGSGKVDLDNSTVGHILDNNDNEDDLEDEVVVNGMKSSVLGGFLVYFGHLAEALNHITNSLADGAHVAAGKIADISHKTHDVYLVSKDQFVKTEETVANKAHDLFLYTQEEFEYVVREMRKEANRHAFYIGLLSGICSYFLMFPIIFLLKTLYKKFYVERSRISFFCRSFKGEKKPLLRKGKNTGSIDFDL